MSWKLRECPLARGRRRRARGSGPRAAASTGSARRPLAGIGGCWWTIVERSSRTMIRCTPVCGPAPVRKLRQDLAVGRAHGEVERRRAGLRERFGRLPVELVLARRRDRRQAPASRLRRRSPPRASASAASAAGAARASLARREEVARVGRHVAADLEHDLSRAAASGIRRGSPCHSRPLRKARTRPANESSRRRAEPLAPDREEVAEHARPRAVDEHRARRVERVQRIGAARRRRGGRGPRAAAAAAGRCRRAAAAPCGRRRSRRARRRPRGRRRSVMPADRPAAQRRPAGRRAARSPARATPAAGAGGAAGANTRSVWQRRVPRPA